MLDQTLMDYKAKSRVKIITIKLAVNTASDRVAVPWQLIVSNASRTAPRRCSLITLLHRGAALSSRYCTAALLSHHFTAAPRRCSLITLLHRSAATSSLYCTAAMLSQNFTAPRRCSLITLLHRGDALITLLHRSRGQHSGAALSSLYCTGHSGSTAALLFHHFIAQVTGAAPRRCSLIFNAAMPGDGRTTRSAPAAE